MPKNKKNKKTKKYIPFDQLEQNAMDYLQNGRYRKAKDVFKELCKHDNEKYLPDLLKSYKGLAKQMLKNSQTTEAQTVIDQIKALDPDFDINTLKTQINIKKSDNKTAINEYIEYLSSGRNDLDGSELLKAADLMVTAFRDFPPLSADRPELNNDLCAVRDAIECISAEKFDEANDSIRGIKRNSIFSHWKLFIKGMIAFYAGDDAKANGAFTILPDNTLPHKAAEPFLLIMNNGSFEKQNKSDLRLVHERACTLMGLHEFAKVIPNANHMWQTGRHRDSFQHMLNNHKDFPSEGSGLMAHLTTFFFNSVFNIDHAAAAKYMTYLVKNNKDWYHNNKLIWLLVAKLAANRGESDEDDYFVVDLWEQFRGVYKNIHGENKKLDSIVFAHLGAIFSRTEESNDFFFPFFSRNRNKDNLRNSKLAINYLEKSINCNGKDKDVYLGLLKVYESINEKSKFNRLLDSMIKRFPEDKEILVRTGTACIHRKVYVKAVKYLERAFKLDPLDSNTKDTLIAGYLRIARNNFTKKKIAAGRDSYKRAIEVGSPESHDFNIGHAYIYSRWAALEYANGSHEVGNEMMQKAQSLNVPRISLLYFSFLIFKVYKVPLSFIENLDKEIKVEFNNVSTAETVQQLLQVLVYIEIFGDFPWLSIEKKRIKSFAVKAAKNKNDKCSRNVAKEIVQFVFSDQNRYRFNADYTIAQSFIKKMLSLDKKDPLFLFYEFMLQSSDYRFQADRKALNRIKKILTIAEERNEAELIKDVKREISKIEDAASQPFFGGHDKYDEDDEDEMEKAGEDIFNAALNDIFGNSNDEDGLNEMERILGDLIGIPGRPKKRKKPRKPPKSKKTNPPEEREKGKKKEEEEETDPDKKPKYKQMEFF